MATELIRFIGQLSFDICRLVSIFHERLMVMPGNILDVIHHEEVFRQLLPVDTIIVFDNGAYVCTNSKMIDDNGMGLVTCL